MRRTRLHKQLRRQLMEKKQEFFIICPPGFENECLLEIQSLFPESGPAQVEKGGILLHAPLHFVPAANRQLRTASRILMRIGRFTATDFTTMKKKLSDIPWNIFFPEGCLPSVRVLCHKCRLYHSEAIAQRVQEVFTQKTASEILVPPIPEKPLPSLYIRGNKDRFTLSIDSSGPLLYLRGIKTSGGRATLRENLAAAILMAAGYTPSQPLMDPMCGSGTFSMEAALMASSTPPGIFRTFAWENWPVFLLMPPQETPPTCLPFKASILASDRDAKAIQSFRKVCQNHSFLQEVEATEADFFSMQPSGHPPGLVLLNPPYGIRIHTRAEATRLRQKIVSHLLSHWKGWRMGLLIPKEEGRPQEFGNYTCRHFQHGGIDMQLLTGKLHDS
ncbi:hypothetical protein OOT00_12355 [Desulfobotulus sp. H1]|uniref:Uncharacterized protein n=1 Tax=Desulfobotulus pelophilus TaxID=2823377 RepID=A0ABT3NBD3_9BACT|nr:hypothetical protein [Desulfobotulus pelophilus]MCW7754774.1 hypothetical protein [Desulfobotulus pelophilus]